MLIKEKKNEAYQFVLRCILLGFRRYTFLLDTHRDS